MARQGGTTARGAAAQENLNNAAAANYTATGAPLFNAASGAIQNQIANPGYDPTTAAAIQRSGINSANSAFDAAQNSASQRAGATGNEAAFYGANNKLAQAKGAADANAATTAQMDIGQQALKSQQQAIQDASQLYGTNTNAATARAGIANNAMIARPSVLQDVEGIYGMVSNAGTSAVNAFNKLQQ